MLGLGQHSQRPAHNFFMRGGLMKPEQNQRADTDMHRHGRHLRLITVLKRGHHHLICVVSVSSNRIRNAGRKQASQFSLAHPAIRRRHRQARCTPAIEGDMVQDRFNKLVLDVVIRVHDTLLCSGG